MSHVAWTAGGLADLARLQAFYTQHDAALVERVTKLISRDLRLLARFPNLGREIKGSRQRRFSIRFGKGAFIF